MLPAETFTFSAPMIAANDSRAFQLKDIEAALRRAAPRARQIAKQTGTPLVIVEDGRVIELEVTDEEIASFERELNKK